ncbi:MAG: alpha/beta hydrolase [Actinomycetes bacterium]
MGVGFVQQERAVLAHRLPQAEVRTVRVAAGSARALVAGTGPDVVLLPGGSMPAAAWAPLMAELDGFRLTALELPGFCGPSDALPLRPETVRTEAVRFVERSLNTLGVERASLVACSMGALWSFWFALEHPERVRSIVTMGCPALLAGTSAPLPMRLMAVPALGRLMLRTAPPSARQVDRALAGAGVDLSAVPDVRDLVVELERLPGYPDAWLGLLHAVLRLTGPRPGVVLSETELAAVRQPVLMLWGEGDPFGPVAAGERAARVLPEAQFAVVPGGHAPWLAPGGGAARRAADFLQRTTSRAGDAEVG